MKTKNLLICTIFLAFVMSFTSAFGIGSFYGENSPLVMHYGETKTISINAQNMIGDEDITIKVEIKQGSDIASLEQDTYTILTKTSDTMIPIKITIPEDYATSSQRVELETKIVTTDQQGMVTLGTGYKTSFEVIISEEKEQTQSSSFLLIIILIAILVLVVVIFMILKNKNK
jgi:RsiW-degrading membrane proteinase PrsW (M82 family)